jgi:hypothetical protein
MVHLHLNSYPTPFQYLYSLPDDVDVEHLSVKEFLFKVGHHF